MEAYILLIDCLLIALDAHMFSHNGYVPGTKDKESTTQVVAGPGPGPGAAAPWALGLGPGPISVMAEHMCIKGNQ